ncbi:cuticle protein LPCP-23-like [Planococcus citri]|uniref:cuticle protein LPCP-23-like n=1 Tax=Planococcus citri TaxID=170843 RepID=UPI0031F9E3DA
MMTFLHLISILALLCTSYAAYVPLPASVTPTYNYPTAVPAVASQSQSVIRSLDGNSVISSYSKAVDTPHSSVRKYDSRINNDAVVYTHVPAVSYAAPVYHKPTYVSSPYYHYTAPSYSHSAYPASYSAPVYTAAPAAVYHHHPTVYHAAPAPSYYHAPAPVKAVPVPTVHAPVAHQYSDASSVSHLTFEGFGAHYGW